jgi:hypothetical protein
MDLTLIVAMIIVAGVLCVPGAAIALGKFVAALLSFLS